MSEKNVLSGDNLANEITPINMDVDGNAEAFVSFELDWDGIIRDISGATRFFNFETMSFRGQNFWKFVGTDYEALLDDLINRAISSERFVNSRLQLRFSDGTDYDVELTLKFFRSANRFIATLANSQYINGLIENLAQTTAEWTHALDSFDDPIYVLDLEDRVVRANRAFYRSRNLTAQDVIGREITTIMHPKGETFPCPVCVARQRREDTYIILEQDHPNNSARRPIEVMVRTIRNRGGQPIGTLMGIRDLTRTRQAESELQRLNQHVHLLLESTGEGIFGVDKELRCTFVNRAAAAMLGYSRDEMLNRDMHDLIHYAYENKNVYPRVLSPILRTITEGTNIVADNEVLWDKAGKSFPAHYTANPIVVDEKVTGAVVVFRNVTEARAMTRRMDYLATHDPLTGLVNRLEFEKRLDSIIQRCHQNFEAHILCYMDLDQFKVVNDTCGHIAGDALLRQISSVLKEKIRRVDTLARLGGDEFGVILQNCPIDQALRIVNNMRETVREFRFIWSDKVFSIGVSIGVVALDLTATNRAAALSAADAACYLAKESGRNRVHIYQADDEALVRRHGEMQWIARIQTALEREKFRLTYQPIARLSQVDDRLRFELLVRLEDDFGQLVPPGAFISAAERYDLMPAIDRWVIVNALQWLSENDAVLTRLDFCTINISAISLNDENFCQFIIQQIQKFQIPSRKICLELTETAAVSNLERVVNLIKTLRASGCLFALDDFGSGMSSFAYLKNLPIDFLKIDGNFIRDINDDPVDFAMVQAINQIGQVMGIRTIAEFVESEAVADKIAKLGIEFAQGYHFSKPRPIEDLLIDQLAIEISH